MSTAVILASRPTSDQHITQLVIDGDVEKVRQRLINALQRIDYLVITEDPLYATYTSPKKREWPIAFNFEDINRKLTIGLRRIGTDTTLATFEYTINNVGKAKSYKLILEREAEAIAALTKVPSEITNCSKCGLEPLKDSRFCRGCGAQLDMPDPAELTALKITGQTRAGYMKLVYGVMFLLYSLLLLTPMLLSGQAHKMIPVIVIFSVGGLAGITLMASGLWHLHRTLNPKLTEANSLLFKQQNFIQEPAISILSSQDLAPSVTEGTTELLALSQKTQEPIYIQNREKKSVNTDRTMAQ